MLHITSFNAVYHSKICDYSLRTFSAINSPVKAELRFQELDPVGLTCGSLGYTICSLGYAISHEKIYCLN